MKLLPSWFNVPQNWAEHSEAMAAMKAAHMHFADGKSHLHWVTFFLEVKAGKIFSRHMRTVKNHKFLFFY